MHQIFKPSKIIISPRSAGALENGSGGILGIAFGSINSGLPKDIVQQIIQAEKVPLIKMEDRKGKIEDKKKLLADLTARVEKLQGNIYANKTDRSFRELAITSSNTNIIPSVDKNIAEPGSYQIEVLQLAKKSSAITNGVEDKDKTYLGVGYIQYTLPNGDEKEVYIDQENSSLTGIAKLINKDAENGLQATVINSGDESDSPWKMIVSLKDTGDQNNAEFPSLYLVDGEEDLFLEKNREAQDAKIKLDGFEIDLPANSSSDLIPGVSLDLKKASPGDEITIEVTEDVGKISEKMGDVVENINNIIRFIKEQNNMTEATDTSRTLGGDITLQTIESRLRSAIFANIDTDFGPRRVGDIGITFQRDGLVAFDQQKFEAVLNKNYQEVSQIVSGKFTKENGKTKGFMDNLEIMAKGALKNPSGTLVTRKQGLNSQVRQIDNQITRKQSQIDKKEQALKAKFSRLEETMSRIRSQGSGLAGLQGGGGMNPVQQLG